MTENNSENTIFNAVAKFDYQANEDGEIDLEEGKSYPIFAENENGWWFTRNSEGKKGWVPSNYLEKCDEETKEAINEIKNMDLDVKICKKCEKEVLDSFVIAKENHYHLDCFKCSGCEKSLGGAGYIEKDNKFFCEDCYHKSFSPKCAACGETIKGKYISALGKTWHEDHFVCNDCAKKFETERFRKRDQKPYCDDCYHKNFTIICDKCKNPVSGKAFTANNKNFHPDCFVCFEDNEKIPETEQFHLRDDHIYCQKHYKEKYIKTCARCEKEIPAKFINVQKQFFHENCWTCKECNRSLLDGNFSEKDNQFYCLEHGKKPEPEKSAQNAAKTEEKSSFLVGEDNTLVNSQKGQNEPQEKVFYPYKELVSKETLPNNVNFAKREDYLTDEEFKDVFNMERADFDSLALWKQRQLKKKVKLF